jgi:DNA-binding IclR family transcriptional regulator
MSIDSFRRTHQLANAELDLLRALYLTSAPRRSELVTFVRLPAQTVASALRRLIDKGLVVRQRHGYYQISPALDLPAAIGQDSPWLTADSSTRDLHP